MGNAPDRPPGGETLIRPQRTKDKRPRRSRKWLLPIRPPGPLSPESIKASVRARLAVARADTVLCIYLDLPPEHHTFLHLRHRGPLISHHDRVAVLIDFTGGDLDVGELFVLTSYGFFFQSRQRILDRECCFVPWFEFSVTSPAIIIDPARREPPTLQIGTYRCTAEKLRDSNFADFLLAVLLDLSIALSREVQAQPQPPPRLEPTLGEVVVRSVRTVPQSGALWAYPAIPKELYRVARDVTAVYCTDEVLIAVDHCMGETIMDLGWTIVTTDHIFFTFSKQMMTLREYAGSVKIENNPLQLACPHRDSIHVITTPFQPATFAVWLLTLQQDLQAYFAQEQPHV